MCYCTYFCSLIRRLNMELITARSPQQHNGYDCGVYVLGANVLACRSTAFMACICTASLLGRNSHEAHVVSGHGVAAFSSLQPYCSCSLHPYCISRSEASSCASQPWRTWCALRERAAWTGRGWTLSCVKPCPRARPGDGALTCWPWRVRWPRRLRSLLHWKAHAV